MNRPMGVPPKASKTGAEISTDDVAAVSGDVREDVRLP